MMNNSIIMKLRITWNSRHSDGKLKKTNIRSTMRAWYFTFIRLPQQLIALPFSQCPKICAWVHSQFHYPAYTVNFIIQHTQSISLSSIHSQFHYPAYTVNFIIKHIQSISLSSIHSQFNYPAYTVNFIIQHTQSISLSSIHSQFHYPAYT